MFPLFELAKILKFGGGENGSGKQNVTVRGCAWKEVGEMSQLALYFSNDYLLLRYCIRGRAPVVRQIPWLQDQPIVDLCFDATGTWLLVVTVKTSLFIIPALTLMNSSAHVNQLWKIDDVTEIKPVPRKGGCTPTCVTWWYTLNDQHIAVIGTQQGDIMCVDLLRNAVLGETSIPESIANIDLVQDDRQSVTYALISARSGSQWKLLLEQKNMEVHWVEERGIHDQMDARPLLPIYNFVNQTVTEDVSQDFLPLKFYNFGKGVSLSAQYARGRHFVAAHDSTSQTYQVYDSNLEHNPLFVYKIPANTENLLLTDKLMFMTQVNDGKTQLMLLSNQMSETSLDDHINFNKDAIVQSFGFPASETIVAVFKRSYPFYWHEKREEELLQKSSLTSNRESSNRDKLATDAANVISGDTYSQPQAKPKSESEEVELSAAYSIQISTHTVLDGCIVVTQEGAYECRPRVSPERYFLDLALTTSDSHQTELLGIMLSLDINMMYELAAEYRLARGDFVHSIRLYQLSKCPYIKRVANFAHYGRIPEVMNYLKQVLGNRSLDLNTLEKKQLADMALHCYVHQIISSHGGDKGLVQALRDFLLSSFSYDEMTALTLLSTHNLMDLLFELAKSRGLIGEALDLLVQQGHVSFSTPQLDILNKQGVSIHLARVRDGTFLRCMTTDDFVQFLVEKPQLAMQFLSQLSMSLSSMDMDMLLLVAQLFDPSKPVVKEVMAKELDSEGWGQRGGRKRSNSISSMSSFMSSISTISDQSDQIGDATLPSISELVHFFILVVLHLNEKHRQPKFHTDFLEEYVSFRSESEESEKNVTRKPRLLTLQPAAIGCGQNHGALARNGDLYTWGSTDHGRLGHGDITTPHGISPAQRVETLHMLKIQVVSVSCGAQHTLVLSNQGLYSWGSSQYGQVGAGQTQKYTRPMLLDSVQDVKFVSVSCGQYHSMALAADGRVFTWGWGVHGNLGHGNVEDCLIPTNLRALNEKQVTRISAGYSHSIVCTARGAVYTFGCGMFGQLGHASTEKRTLPVRVHGIPDPVHTVATKYFHNVAVTIDNQVYMWGASPQVLRYMAHLTRRQRLSATGSAHLGPQAPEIPKHLMPRLVDTTMVFDKIVQVSCGNNHSVMITQDGEMYSWGKNYDGQLGLGNKMEQSQPTMVVSVNDKKIVHICCGAEFAMGLDLEGTVYSWGRNDTGQLGWSEQLESSGKYSNRRPKHSRDRSSAGFEREFLVPSKLKGFPPLTVLSRKMLMPLKRRKHSHESTDWWSDECYEDVRESLDVPNLSSVGDPPYGSQVISVVLKHLSSFCEPTKLLRMCIDHEDCQSAADVCQSGGLFSQALYYRLRSLSHCSSQVENVCDTAARIASFYINAVYQNYYQREPPQETIRQTLGHVFDFWGHQNLPVSDLESLLSSHMDQIAYPLSLMVLRERKQSSDVEVLTDSKFGNIPDEIQKQFSAKFLLNLTTVIVNRIEQGQSCEEYSKILAGEKPGLKVEPPNNLIPMDKLWQEILQNLSKDMEKRSHITMSTNEVEYLTAAKPLFLQTNEDVSDSSQPIRAVLFTCGHNFTEKLFLETTLTQLSNDLTKSRLPLNNSAILLSQYYKKKGYIPMACPKCVFATIQDIRVG